MLFFDLFFYNGPMCRVRQGDEAFTFTHFFAMGPSIALGDTKEQGLYSGEGGQTKTMQNIVRWPFSYINLSSSSELKFELLCLVCFHFDSRNSGRNILVIQVLYLYKLFME